jgi:hypothetical protein
MSSTICPVAWPAGCIETEECVEFGWNAMVGGYRVILRCRSMLELKKKYLNNKEFYYVNNTLQIVACTWQHFDSGIHLEQATFAWELDKHLKQKSLFWIFRASLAMAWWSALKFIHLEIWNIILVLNELLLNTVARAVHVRRASAWQLKNNCLVKWDSYSLAFLLTVGSSVVNRVSTIRLLKW